MKVCAEFYQGSTDGVFAWMCDGNFCCVRTEILQWVRGLSIQLLAKIRCSHAVFCGSSQSTWVRRATKLK